MRLTDRLPYAAAAIIAALFLWQAMRLEDFSPFGPGPGIFPQIATGLATAIAVLLLLIPVLSREGDAKPGDKEEALAPEERRTFRLYMAALLLLVAGATWLGFLLTCMLVTLLLTWFAERQKLHKALLFGLICGITGTLGLGFMMQIEIPYGAADSLLMRPFR
jgi:hypothetical protein